jgi:hypothetical protein
LASSCGGSTDDGIRLGGAGTSAGGTASGGSSTGGSSGVSAAGGAGGSFGVGAAGAGSGGAVTGGMAGVGTFGASAAGPIAPPGPPLCGGRECAQGQACCLATGQCFDPTNDPAACAPPPPTEGDPRKPCASNAHCAANEFCIDDGTLICQVAGHCTPIDNCGFCSGGAEICRVCACDGNSYPDVQTACRAGARALAYIGAACGETIDFVGGAGGSSAMVPPARVTPCGKDAHCPSGQRCCAITGLCYPPDDPGRCAPPPSGTRFPCTANDQCFPASEYCAGEGCSGPGGCVQLGVRGDCGVKFEPVCGCDGVTYTHASCANERGVRVASQGECP